MATYLLFDDPSRSPAIRHEIGEPVVGRLAFIEHDGTRIVVGDEMDRATFERREDVVDAFWTAFEFGKEDLARDSSVPTELVGPEIVLRALGRVGVRDVVVPPEFPLLAADYLRNNGLGVAVDADAWALRRRQKSPAELEGIERAQRAAETAMLVATRMLRDAERTSDGRLRFEGEILTAELIREAMQPPLQAAVAECPTIIVHSGDAVLSGHDLGMGPIAPDTPCVIDCWPRDLRSGAYADMTRTFVAGTPSDEITRLHKHCRAALDIALEELKPGGNDAYRKVVEYFESHDLPTRESHRGSSAPREGFPHSLGHGVGLEVHEPPAIGPRADAFREGDVVAIEPGLYFEGIGGVRLEDTVLITADGVERFTDPFPYDLEP